MRKNTETEILVHISAPSGARDDARYRAQVEAILGFEPVSCQNVGQYEKDNHDVATSPVEHGHSSFPSHQPQVPPISGPLDLEISGSTVALSNTPPPLDHRFPDRSEGLLGTCNHQHQDHQQMGHTPSVHTNDNTSRNDSFNSPISVVPDSYSENGGAVTRKAEEYPPDSPDCKRQRLLPYNDNHHGHLTPTSKLPTDHDIPQPHPQPQPPTLNNDHNSETDTDRQDPTTTLNNKQQSTDFQTETHDTISTTNNNAFKAVPVDSHTLPSSSAITKSQGNNNRDHTPITNHQTSNENENDNLHSLLNSLPLQISPPNPPISRDSFTTHITPTLEMLEKRLKPSRTYKPIQQIRTLDRLERGYWILNINLIMRRRKADNLKDVNDHHHWNGIPNINTNNTTKTNNNNIHNSSSSSLPNGTNTNTNTNNNNDWDIPLFNRFWSFLSDFISKEGRAGWGIWAILDNHPNGGHVNQQQHDNDDDYTSICTTPLILKVYTWGEVAMHIYLLLFLASERRIRKMGAQWRDSCEDVIICMS